MTSTLPSTANVGTVSYSEEQQRSQGNVRRRPIGLLWKDFFKDPSQWRDNRSNNASQTFPHFQHKVTGDRLWVDGRLNPPWVLDELRRRGLTPSVDREHSHVLQRNDKRCNKRIVDDDEKDFPYVTSLRSCTFNKDLPRGIRIHREILRCGVENECADALITMYAGCGAIDEAKDLFIDYKSRDIITWTVLIAALIQQGETKDALTLFECMKQEGLSPDAITFTVTLKACGAMKAVNTGNSIHGEIARLGLLISDVVLGNALIDMYVKFGHLMKAQQVLEGLPCRDTVSWNTLIAGYVQHQQPEKALACFERMQREALPPDAVTFVCLLKACGTLGAVDMGEQIHEQIINQGLMEENIVLGTALVDMYAKCGALTKAQTVLKELSVRDIVSWNTLISSYAHQGQGEEVFHCIEQMQLEGIYPSPITFGCILKACGTVGDIVKGEQIHDVISRQGLIEFHNSLGSALVDMYAKCGSLAKAKEVFDGLPSRDTVSWSSLIAEYVQQGEAEQAFDCFKQMQQEGLRADGITFACMLKACAILGTVNRGRVVHDEILKEGLLGTDAMLDNALVDMYAKCGVLRKAQLVLEEIPFRDVVCWNALIAGYAQQGESDRALSCFRKMELEGFHPDASTFLSLLTSCCHLGLLEEGCKCFISMITRYNITPDVNHYTCMVDLFGRAGQLQKAACLIAQMPFSDHGSVISALLTACRKLGDMSLGRWAFQRALQLDEIDGAVYALMCDIYSITGSQVDTENS